MTNEIAQYNNNFPSQNELQSVALIAKTAHMSGLYGGVGGEAKIMMILLAAKELGVGPCQALNGGIWSIQNKIEISARLMNGLIRRAGHSIKVIRSDDECCTLKGTRKDGDSFEVSFTKQDAEKAGLWGSNTWKKYPGDMLYNRCMSRLGRRLFSDVIGQCYIEGEIKEAIAPEKLPESQYEEISSKIDNSLNQTASESITSEQLQELMSLGEQIDETCRENMLKYLLDNFSITEDKLSTMPEKAFIACRAGMLNNIKMNQQKAV